MSNNKNAKANLRPPFNKISPEEHRKIASAGGKKSVEVRRAKKTIKAIVDEIMSRNVDKAELLKLGEKVGLSGEYTMSELFSTVAAINSLKKADFSELLDLQAILGEKIDKVMVSEVDQIAIDEVSRLIGEKEV